jgi:succinate--hydroxymethylglutarate CoA-transferase
MTVALRFQVAARRSGLSWGSNALRRTIPGRSYSSAVAADGSLPLAGIRVLDMTRVLAGVSTSLETLLCVYNLS